MSVTVMSAPVVAAPVVSVTESWHEAPAYGRIVLDQTDDGRKSGVMGQQLSAADEDDRSAVATRLAVAIGRINRRIRPSNPELSYGQLSALSSIVRLGPLRPGDLARLESVSAPSVTRLIANLEAKGFVERTPDPVDGRAFYISASEAGADAVLRARQERAALLRELLADCSQDDLDRLTAALPALENAGHVDEAPADVAAAAGDRSSAPLAPAAETNHAG